MGINIVNSWQDFEIETKKGIITMQILPLDTRAILKLSNLKAEDVPDAIEKIFPEHVRNIEGIAVDGKEPDAHTFSSIPSLFPIATRIIERLTTTDELVDADIKN